MPGKSSKGGLTPQQVYNQLRRRGVIKDWGSLDAWPFLTPVQRLQLQARGFTPTSINHWFRRKGKR